MLTLLSTSIFLHWFFPHYLHKCSAHLTLFNIDHLMTAFRQMFGFDPNQLWETFLFYLFSLPCYYHRWTHINVHLHVYFHVMGMYMANLSNIRLKLGCLWELRHPLRLYSLYIVSLSSILKK